MRARVDSTHSIITSRQRVEATVTAEISTMRLDMASALRIEVDSRRRKVDEALASIRDDLAGIHNKVDHQHEATQNALSESVQQANNRFAERERKAQELQQSIGVNADNHGE